MPILTKMGWWDIYCVLVWDEVPGGIHQVSHFVLPFTYLIADLNGDVSTTTTQFDHLTLLDGPKLSDENPAVIIPGHLQVSNADCAHLTFGSFVYGTLDASLTTKPLESHGDIVTIPDDDYDQSEGRHVPSFSFILCTLFLSCISYKPFIFRIHDDESKVTLAPAANEYVTSTSNSNVENLDITSVQQSEVTRSNFLDVTSNTEYNLSSPPDYATSSAALQDSTSQSYLQENRQFQSISPLPSFMVQYPCVILIPIAVIYCEFLCNCVYAN